MKRSPNAERDSPASWPISSTLAAHLIGVIDGALLIAVAWTWQHFAIVDRLKRALFLCALYGAYGGWGCNLLGAAFGTSRMTPIAGAGFRGAPWQEAFIAAGLLTVAAALILMCLIALFGLRSMVEVSDAARASGRESIRGD